jgi:hypothetical protein
MGCRGEILMDNLPKGRPLSIDAGAQSASPTDRRSFRHPKAHSCNTVLSFLTMFRR